MKAISSGGPDGLPASFYKVISDSIALLLNIIFDLSLQSDIIPDIWYSRRSPGDPCNYRTISLTCIACKLMEAGIKGALLVFHKEYIIINASQHGFLAGKSTMQLH